MVVTYQSISSGLRAAMKKLFYLLCNVLPWRRMGVLGGSDTHERLVRELANKANVAVVLVDYTPSPEAKYPVPIEEAYAATRWVAENGKSINVDPSRLAVAGDSVGGNMAAAVTLLAKERRGPNIAFQALFYPVTDANIDTPSYLAYQEVYWLTRRAMKWFWDITMHLITRLEKSRAPRHS
jgi:acetyl esterase